MLTLIVITFLVAELFRPDVFSSGSHAVSDARLSGYAKTAVDAYEHEGRQALAAYLEKLQQTTEIDAILFSASMTELSGRHIPSGAHEVAQKIAQPQELEILKRAFPRLTARPLQGASGEQYVLVAKMPSHNHLLSLYGHLVLLAAIVLIGAAFCYWLAKYLTAPVAKLRQATNELARGNLSARVRPSLGKRRDELASLGSDFDLMAEQIESLLKAQRRLLGDISHELRSPLSRLHVALELARQRAGSEALTALARIQKEAENLDEMIGQLLALTRLETGDLEPARKRLDLRKLVIEIAEDADFEARSRNRSVRVDADRNCFIVGDEDLLRPALENVVRNAIHYTAEGTEVDIKLKTSSTSNGGPGPGAELLTCSAAFAEVTVRDRGGGVAENALSQIFRPFFRVDDARDRESGGAGLGLAITERAVRLHGGKVTATNAADGGLSITISLPLAQI